MSADESTPALQSQPRRYRGDRNLRVVEPEESRPLPASVEAEQKFIASCFADPSGPLIARAAGVPLLARHFFDPKCGVVWGKILLANQRGLPATVDLVAEELNLANELDRIGGYPFLAEVSRMLATTAEGVRYLELVLDYAMVRQGLRDTATASEAFYAWKGEQLEGMFGNFATTFQRLADSAMRRKRPSQRQVASEARAYAQAAMAGTLDKSRAMPFGGLPHTTTVFLPLDVKEEDWLILIGALRNGGKSTIARQHVGHSLVAGRVWVVFLLETSRRRWLNALAAMFAGVNLRELEETRALFPEKARCFDDWMAWIESIMEQQLWIFDDLFYLEDIERQIRDINRRVRERQLDAAIAAGRSAEEAEKLAYGLDGVLGDHLHLVQTRKDFRGNREAQVSFVGRTLKILAKTLDFYNLWCAQLNRGPSNDERRPRMSDLRDSGTLEQDADAIMLLHKPSENKAGLKQTGDQVVHEVELIMAKRRNGPAGVAVDLLQNLKIGSYEETQKTAGARPGMPKPKGGYKREGGA